jgi:hypothetical protein
VGVLASNCKGMKPLQRNPRPSFAFHRIAPNRPLPDDPPLPTVLLGADVGPERRGSRRTIERITETFARGRNRPRPGAIRKRSQRVGFWNAVSRPVVRARGELGAWKERPGKRSRLGSGIIGRFGSRVQIGTVSRAQRSRSATAAPRTERCCRLREAQD